MRDWAAKESVQKKEPAPPATAAEVMADFKKSVTGRQESEGGLPASLKTNMERLGGVSLKEARVTYNSPRPAQLGAEAVTQGANIHLAPGQEKHLAHEAWHAVQQKQGRVRPTAQLAGGIDLNDQPELEKEADEMGQRAVAMHDNDDDE